MSQNYLHHVVHQAGGDLVHEGRTFAVKIEVAVRKVGLVREHVLRRHVGNCALEVTVDSAIFDLRCVAVEAGVVDSNVLGHLDIIFRQQIYKNLKNAHFQLAFLGAGYGVYLVINDSTQNSSV